MLSKRSQSESVECVWREMREMREMRVCVRACVFIQVCADCDETLARAVALFSFFSLSRRAALTCVSQLSLLHISLSLCDFAEAQRRTHARTHMYIYVHRTHAHSEREREKRDHERARAHTCTASCVYYIYIYRYTCTREV